MGDSQSTVKIESARKRLAAERAATIALLREAYEHVDRVQPEALRQPLMWHLAATIELCEQHRALLGLPVNYALDMARAVLGRPEEQAVTVGVPEVGETDFFVGENGPVPLEFVLTWHPVTAEPVEPIEVPLNKHVAWCPEELGEFQVSTREIPVPADESSEVHGG